MARAHGQKGCKPGLRFSQGQGHSSAQQPCDRITGQLLVSHWLLRAPRAQAWPWGCCQ